MTEAIHYSVASNEFEMEVIKNSKQFATYYHKGKKQIIEGKKNVMVLLPSPKSGLQYGYIGIVSSSKKIKDYNELHPYWELVQPWKNNEKWDMVINFSNIAKVSLERLKSSKYILEGKQGGVRIEKTRY